MNVDGGMCFDSSEEEEAKDFGSGGGVRQSSHVGFDKQTGQVEGWDSIWAIINGEDEERKIMEGKLAKGIE